MSKATRARVVKRLAVKAAAGAPSPAGIQGEVFAIKAEDAYRFGFYGQTVARLTEQLAVAQKHAKEAEAVIVASASEGGKHRIVSVNVDEATVIRVPNPDYKGE